MKPITLRQAIGQQLRQFREKAKLRQDVVALCGRRWGLPWDRSTVAAVETGRRHLSAEEWLLLPLVCNEAGIKGDAGEPITYSSLMPDGMRLALTPQTLIYTHTLRGILNRLGRVEPQDEESIDRPQSRLQQAWTDIASGQRLTVPTEALPTDADRKASYKLGVTMNLITQAALATWNRSLLEEREARFQLAGGEIMIPRRAQAVRGSITRNLLREMKPALVSLGVPLKGERSKTLLHKPTYRRPVGGKKGGGQ